VTLIVDGTREAEPVYALHCDGGQVFMTMETARYTADPCTGAGHGSAAHEVVRCRIMRGHRPAMPSVPASRRSRS